MATWMLWMMASVLSGTTYNIGMKYSGSEIPIWSYLFLAGLGLMVLALAFYLGQPTESRWTWLNNKNLTILLVVAGALVALEVSMFNMYFSGAPLSLSRVVSTIASLVLLTLAGVFFFKEVLSPIQITGIFLAIVSSVMVIWK